MDVEFPLAKYGMSRTKYNIKDIPIDAEHRDTLIAANRLNEFRYNNLTFTQRAFVDAFFECQGSPHEAVLAIKMSSDVEEAKRIATKLMRNKVIRHCIQLADAYHAEKALYRFDRETYLNRLHDIATCDVTDFVHEDFDGELKITIPECKRKRAAVSEVKVRTTTNGKGKDASTTTEVSLKFYNARDAIKDLFTLCGGQTIDGKLVDSASAEKAYANNAPIMFNIVGVPTGEFIPAPESPYNKTIEHHIDGTEAE